MQGARSENFHRRAEEDRGQEATLELSATYLHREGLAIRQFRVLISPKVDLRQVRGLRDGSELSTLWERTLRPLLLEAWSPAR